MPFKGLFVEVDKDGQNRIRMNLDVLKNPVFIGEANLPNLVVAQIILLGAKLDAHRGWIYPDTTRLMEYSGLADDELKPILQALAEAGLITSPLNEASWQLGIDASPASVN